tara:strand:+ start:12 stop:1118 length:1107 start_codon:yes stop_codon:yes gene_type:complete
MKITKLKVNTKSEKYPILIGSNLISKIKKICDSNLIKFEKCLLVVDSNVPKKLVLNLKKDLQNRKVYLSFFKASEKNKNQKSVNNILKVLLSKNFSRQDCLITIGGGITGDVGGFAASIFKRGLQFINIPTTLLSQVDSSVGGKTGINSSYGKNLIGNFYQPKIVICDTNFLNSLPKREIICGYAEILKHSLISDKKFFNYLCKNVSKILNLESPFINYSIYTSCKIKKKVIEKDEKEKSFRKILNFGHTFAHAYEASLNYSKKLNHGEAVILGMISALKFSVQEKFMKFRRYQKIVNHINSSRLTKKIKRYFSKKDIKKILLFMTKDKKNNTDKINLILLKNIGSPIIDKVYNKYKLQIFLKKELID